MNGLDDNRAITVVALGTLDTKGREYAYLCDRLRDQGAEVILVDAGILGEPSTPATVTREEVAHAAGADLIELIERGDRGTAVQTMARGATEIVRRLHADGRLDGVIGLGGSGGSSLISQAMRALPIGIPKLLVSTVASGDTRPYVGPVDITLMHSVVDVAGINRISARMLTNAAAAIAAMAAAQTLEPDAHPLLAASMFGVTTPCVTRAREWLEKQGYEVLVFHQTGTGGEAMEALVRAGFFAGILDVTTTELCDELVGGVFPAHPDRMQSAGATGIPQVVSVGALDMVNFGPRATVPEKFQERKLHVHNPNVTLMRTTPQECAELGVRLAAKLNGANGPTALFIPLRGVSAISTEGQPFCDHEADEALFDALRNNLADQVELYELDCDVNNPEFALAMAERLVAMIKIHDDTRSRS